MSKKCVKNGTLYIKIDNLLIISSTEQWTWWIKINKIYVFCMMHQLIHIGRHIGILSEKWNLRYFTQTLIVKMNCCTRRHARRSDLTTKNYFGENRIKNNHSKASMVLSVILLCLAIFHIIINVIYWIPFLLGIIFVKGIEYRLDTFLTVYIHFKKIIWYGTIDGTY